MSDVLRAMISSTTRDLPEHRKQAEDACLRQEFLPKMMEHLPPSPDDAVRLSLELVDAADVYVLILGLRYGEVPAGYDKSYTHLEYDRAVERGSPILAMLSSDDHPFRGGDVERGPGAEKLDALRAAVGAGGYALFSSAEDLRAQLVHGLGALKPRLQPTRSDSPHYVHRPDLPPTPYIAHPYTLLDVHGLQGRGTELGALSAWVADPASARVLVLVAIGGMGKSALTWRWFHDHASQAMPAMTGRVWWSFYETDATFANFVLRTLAYVTGQTVESLLPLSPPEREDALLRVLDREPHLVVLDGLERLLLAYSRADAARLADDELDEQTANVVAGERGLPASAAASFTGQSRLRVTADPRVGSFLRRLATVRAARLLVTSRLYPAELQDAVTAEPVPGAAPYFLRGLAPADALRLWRGLGGSGTDDELTGLFTGFDYYPLLIRALAGEVRRFRPAPGDLAAWRVAHPAFDPFGLPLKQRNSHVLAFALNGLTATNQGVLDVIAAFRAPVRYDTLVALLVGSGRPCADEAMLDRELTELEERGLLGWDRRANRYDLHPVVRGVTWARLDAQTRLGIDENLAAHFESIPLVGRASSIDQLTVPIELFHTLVRLGRLLPAAELVTEHLMDALFTLGAYRELADLAASLVETPAAAPGSGVDDDSMEAIAAATLFAGMGYAITADLARAMRFLDRAHSAVRAVRDDPPGSLLFILDIIDSMRAVALCGMGRLVEAEQTVWRAAGSSPFVDVVVGLAPLVMAMVRMRQGEGAEGAAWLSDYRINREAPGENPFACIALDELAQVALRTGDDRALDHILTSLEDLGGALAASGVLPAAVARSARRGSTDDDRQAVDRLQDVLVSARTAGLVDIEVRAGKQLAHLHLAGGRHAEAGEAVAAALEIAERCGHRLHCADLLCLRAGMAVEVGAAAADAAAAYQAAWCDGPPYSYAAALAEARRLLATVDAPEPSLPISAPPVARPGMLRPAPSLRANDTPIRLLGWPVTADAPTDPVAALVRDGWFGVSDAALAALAAAVVGPSGSEVRARLRTAALTDRDRLEVRLWLVDGGYADGPPLPDLLRAEDAYVRSEALAEAVGALPLAQRQILSVDLDGDRPYIDPGAPVPFAHVLRAVADLGGSEADIRAAIAELGQQLGVPFG